MLINDFKILTNIKRMLYGPFQLGVLGVFAMPSYPGQRTIQYFLYCHLLCHFSWSPQTSLHSGLLISGDYYAGSIADTVEMFVPATGKHCQLTNMPTRRSLHTMDARTVCGGSSLSGDNEISCVSLTDDGTWEIGTTLLEERSSYKHITESSLYFVRL